MEQSIRTLITDMALPRSVRAGYRSLLGLLLSRTAKSERRRGVAPVDKFSLVLVAMFAVLFLGERPSGARMARHCPSLHRCDCPRDAAISDIGGPSMTIARISPVLGVKSVRKSAEYYRDVLGFSLDPVDGVFQPTLDEPDGVYAIVKKGDFWIHFQISAM